VNRVKAVLLSAGLGTRLRPLTEMIPKCLVPVAGQPIMEFWIDSLTKVGVTEILVNTHSLPHLVTNYITQVNRRDGMKLVESYEPELLGSAGTLSANRSFADDTDHVLLIYADNLSDIDLRAMLAYHRGHQDPVTMLLFHSPNPKSCGIVELDGTGRILSFIEKPQHPKTDLANAGVYVVDAAAYREMAEADAFDLGFDVLPNFVGRMRGWITQGCHLDIGTPDRYQQAQTAGHVLLNKRLGKRRAAVFLDRDGTLIEPVHYLSKPDEVKIVPDGAKTIRKLRQAEFACVLVTNQSAVGRGIISTEELQTIHMEMLSQLSQEGAELDGIYVCPTVPKTKDRTKVEHLDRKPGPGLLWQASRELNLDVNRSWMIGDMISDLLAGRNAGCAGSVLVHPDRYKHEPNPKELEHCYTAETLSDAATLILTERENNTLSQPTNIKTPV